MVPTASIQPRHGMSCPVSGQSLTRSPLPTQFIISGSLSVAAEKNHTSCLVSLIGGPRDGVGFDGRIPLH